jgi:D-3-phosphoglycerate dehydrogenase / 2-oxoglutarate reductase
LLLYQHSEREISLTSALSYFTIRKKNLNKKITFSTPGGNSIAACELTCSLILMLARPVCAAYVTMKDGKWDRKIFTGTEVCGKTLAVLGLGRIGREVGSRMKAFGMQIIGYDPITTEAEANSAGIKKMELEEIWPLADYITVHVPLLKSTRSKLKYFLPEFFTFIKHKYLFFRPDFF